MSSRIFLITGSSSLFKKIYSHHRSNHRVFHYIELRSASSLHELIEAVIPSRAESSKLIPIFPEPSLHLRTSFMFYFNCSQHVLTVLLGLSYVWESNMEKFYRWLNPQTYFQPLHFQDCSQTPNMAQSVCSSS